MHTDTYLSPTYKHLYNHAAHSQSYTHAHPLTPNLTYMHTHTHTHPYTLNRDHMTPTFKECWAVPSGTQSWL